MKKKKLLIILACIGVVCAVILTIVLVNRNKHVHEWDDGVVTVEPSCKATGVKTFTCSGCGRTKIQTIATTEHAWDSGVVTTPATCTSDGAMLITCTICGETKDKKIQTTGHTWDEGTVITSASCTVSGEKAVTCLVCGETSTIEIPASGHTWDSGSITKTAACLTPGEKLLTCTTCGETNSEKTPAQGHQYKSVVTAPTCAEEGFTTYTCSRCKDSYVGNFTSANGHVWNDGVVQKESTDEETGEKLFTCTVCKTTKVEGLPASGHDYTATVTKPTCTEIGYTTYTCKDCQSTYTDNILPASGHAWDAGVISKMPTETDRGSKTYTCTVCSETRSEVIPAFGDPSALYTRIDSEGNEDPNGEYLLFGSYPQSVVTDEALITALNAQSGSWTAYPYYIGGSICEYMYYRDVTLDGESYRGVYFTEYRPYLTKSSSSAENSYQSVNGYTTNVVYWFRFEPIKWRILSEDRNTAFLLCEIILDSQVFQDAYISTDEQDTYYNNAPNTPIGIYASDYEYSLIRAWLNETFYEDAFGALKQVLILTTEVDNSARSTNPNDNPTAWYNGENQYACNDTQDKIFFLSKQEVSNSAYGFDGDYKKNDVARRKKSTDYAKVQGIKLDADGNGAWWLRSPYASNSLYPDVVQSSGSANADDFGYIAGAFYGVVPALQIRLH